MEETRIPVIGSSVLPILNKLQDILAPLESDYLAGFNLPQVAVVGSQSSGKSSVLEALVGRDFLPRGTGICTRRPLLLQLEQVSGTDNEWGEFRHLPGKQFSDFSDIRNEIQAETEKGAGTDKGVSDEEIRLKIFSPNVIDMTLVDLPGMTKVPLGDQPPDIERRIKDLIMRYIRQENCIILAVSPANSDLATSDAMQIAREVDPTGLRTLGVITKLDIMDKGTDACNILLGKVIPLRLGYVGVVNRSQHDINNNCMIRDAFTEEEKFFQSHPIYGGLSDRCGILKLANKLNQILEQHIRAVLPKLKDELKSRLLAVGNDLRTYGSVMELMDEQRLLLSNILTKYCEGYSCMVDGKSQEFSTKELSGGARIKYTLQSSFVRCLEDVDPCGTMTDENIRIAIQNATGLKNSIFVPEVPFENLVKVQIARLLEPSLQCLHYIHEELTTISYACEPIGMQRFPVLRRHMSDILKKFLSQGVKTAGKMIQDIIAMEVSYINSSHPNFIGGKKALQFASERVRASQTSSMNPSHPSSNGEKKTAEMSLQNRNGMEQVITKPESSQKNVDSSTNVEANGSTQSGQNEGGHPQSYSYKAAAAIATAGYLTTKIRGVSAVFANRRPSMEDPYDHPPAQTSTSQSMQVEAADSAIQLNRLPSNLRLLGTQTEDETVEIEVTKLLVSSYFNIVRKNIQDLVPKAIMHFLVLYSKNNLLGTLMQSLYRDNLFGDLLREEDEIVVGRKRTNAMFLILQQALESLDDFEADVYLRKSNSSMM